MRAEYNFFMKQIELGGKKGKGRFLLVNDEDFGMFSYFKWCINNKGYAVAHIPKSGDFGQNILAHRLIFTPLKGMDIDHINGNKLDCRRENLRFANRSQNTANKRYQGKSSKYKGVCYHKCAKFWTAKITVNYKQIGLGSFKQEKLAAEAYDEAAKKYFGEFARLNFRLGGRR